MYKKQKELVIKFPKGSSNVIYYGLIIDKVKWVTDGNWIILEELCTLPPEAELAFSLNQPWEFLNGFRVRTSKEQESYIHSTNHIMSQVAKTHGKVLNHIISFKSYNKGWDTAICATPSDKLVGFNESFYETFVVKKNLAIAGDNESGPYGLWARDALVGAIMPLKLKPDTFEWLENLGKLATKTLNQDCVRLVSEPDTVAAAI